MAITSFSGEHRFLSNFEPAVVVYDGHEYPTVEHAYVAAKSFDDGFRAAVRKEPKPGNAKRMGRDVALRPDWQYVRVPIMRDLSEQKYTYPELIALLDSTSPHELIEGNTWGDTFWGQCPIGTGHNNLGKILMGIRDDMFRIFV
jgi:ribA/ribD-fused uncharacterized protein